MMIIWKNSLGYPRCEIVENNHMANTVESFWCMKGCTDFHRGSQKDMKKILKQWYAEVPDKESQEAEDA